MHRFRVSALVLACLLAGAGAQAAGPSEDRHASLLRAPLLGTLDNATVLTVNLALPWRDPAGLDALLRDLYDPLSPRYRQFLEPAEFIDRFGPSPADLQALVGFARAHGLAVVGQSPNRQYIQVRATAGALGRALGLTFNRRRRPDGTEFYASEQPPRFSLAGLDVQAVGLDNFNRPQFRHKAARRDLPQGARGGTAAGPPGFPGSYMGYDFRDAYAPDVPAGLNGAGQVIGLLEPEGFSQRYVAAYEAGSVPPLRVAGPPVVRTVGGYDGVPDGIKGNIAEVCLDIELAQAMAPGATIKVFEGNPVDNFETVCDNIYTAMATDTPLCRQISCSWGGFGQGDPLITAGLAQFAAQGQSYFQASGDFGAYSSANDNPQNQDTPDCLSNLITEVGGTQLFTSNPLHTPTPNRTTTFTPTTTPNATPLITYSSESTWNDYQCDPRNCSLSGIGDGNDSGGASGGGVFPLAIPTYQQGMNTALTAAGGSTTTRNIPDVAMLGESFVVVDANGSNPSDPNDWEVYDGTSGAAPLMAGFVALVNQQAVVSGRQPGLGLANYAFYALGKGGSYGSVFHDINDSSNNNLANLYPVSYNAVNGYDLCTGWGSPNGLAMVNALVGPLPTGSPTATFTPSPTVTPTFTASPTWTVSPTHSATATETPVPVGQVFVYPNPARDNAMAEYKADHAEGLRLMIFDVAGEAVDQENLGQAFVGKNLIPLRLSKLAPGIYWVELLADEGSGYQPRSHFKLAIVRP